jgi:dCMP deaminase
MKTSSMTSPLWHSRYLKLAEHLSSWSKDPSTKVGCVIVGPDKDIRATGFNGFPRGVADDERLNDRDRKYMIICHAEENAIMNAARVGVPLQGCTAYVTWPPCTRCARSLIQAGICAVCFPSAEVPERWRADFEISVALLKEAGIDAFAFDMGSGLKALKLMWRDHPDGGVGATTAEGFKLRVVPEDNLNYRWSVEGSNGTRFSGTVHGVRPSQLAAQVMAEAVVGL